MARGLNRLLLKEISKLTMIDLGGISLPPQGFLGYGLYSGYGLQIRRPRLYAN
jgi:hypothetical protein